MAKKNDVYKGAPDCPSSSLSKKTLPNGDSSPSPMSASRKMSTVGSSGTRPVGFTLEEKKVS